MHTTHNGIRSKPVIGPFRSFDGPGKSKAQALPKQPNTWLETNGKEKRNSSTSGTLGIGKWYRVTSWARVE